jgi:deazaflavin-dependent oxidoreductase (nitroreductase family)
MSERTEEERLKIIRESSQDHLREYVESGGEEGYTMRGVPTLILTTTGRRSGKRRSTPVMFGRDGDNFVIVGSLGGASKHPYWYLNLLEDPDVEVQHKTDCIRGTASVATGEERERLWKIMTEVFPTYDRYQERTDRELPVVVIEPKE